jgi:hypothetical protein
VISRIERVVMLGAPVIALATVALGLRLGAPEGVRAAVVYGAPASRAGTGLAWQVMTFEESARGREVISLANLQVLARAGAGEARWRGATNEDGAAEVLLALPTDEGVDLEVSAGRAVLASGPASMPVPATRSPPRSAWARFARREGAIALDVAVLGQHVPAGFPATIWVRATDPMSGAALPGVAIELAPDSSLLPSSPGEPTDERGWAKVLATPIGHAVTMILRANARDGREGTWAGALFVSPGASRVIARARYLPSEEPAIDLVVPNLRKTAYFEIDDAQGRVWAQALRVENVVEANAAMPTASLRAPRLAPGLYWAVASDDPMGAAQLGPGTSVGPFFVASTDDEALSFGTDRSECMPPSGVRDVARVVSLCLALAAAAPVPRWKALDGFDLQHARDRDKHARGLGLAVGAIVVAALLETILLLRAAAASRARLRALADTGETPQPLRTGRIVGVVVALLVALLGFVLLAAFVARAG